MPNYLYRSNNNTPEGALHEVDLCLRVLASLQDAEADGIAVRYDWHAAEVGQDELGDFVALNVEWPADLGFGAARKYIDRHFVTV